MSSGKGWWTYLWEEDERVGPLVEERGRRYGVWEALDAGYGDLYAGGKDAYQELNLETVWLPGGVRRCQNISGVF